jgi:hypothetical protein
LDGSGPIIARLEKSRLKAVIVVNNTRSNQTQKVNVSVANDIRSTVELMLSEINQASESTKPESDSSVPFERNTNRDVSGAMEEVDKFNDKVYHVQIHGKARPTNKIQNI